MADFLVVTAIVIFVVAMLGLIWGLESLLTARPAPAARAPAPAGGQLAPETLATRTPSS